MYKVVVEFYQSHIILINADDPTVAAKNVNRLFEQGRVKTRIKSINVYLQNADSEFDLPAHTMKFA